MDSAKDNPASASFDNEKRMYCPHCGNKLRLDDVFCPNCGERVYPISPTVLQKLAHLIILAKKILQSLFLGEKDKIKVFDELFCNNKWNEALEYYELLKSRGFVPQFINEKITLIKENAGFPVLLFLDIESDPRTNEIWEIAAVRMRGTVRLGSFHSLVMCSSKIPLDRLSRHELSQYIRTPRIEKAIESFSLFLGSGPVILVGHNISFDIEELSKHFGKIKEYPSLDTLRLSFFCWPLRYSHTLSDLMGVRETHRARDDVETDIVLFDKIIERIRSFSYLEKSLFITLLDKSTADFLRLFLGKISPLDFSQLKEASKILLSRSGDTHFSQKDFETRITFFNMINTMRDKHIFVSVNGYLPREEYYKNILNMADSTIVPLQEDHILTERRFISELTGEEEPTSYVSLFSDSLEKFCFHKFWEALPSVLDSVGGEVLLYLILWSINTRDGIIDPNFMYGVLQGLPDIRTLLQKSTYSDDCPLECPLRNQLCPTVYPRTNPNLILTSFSSALTLRAKRLIINEAHNLDEFLTEGSTTAISCKDFEALQNELSGQVELTSFADALQQFEKALVEFVEKRDLIQQRRYTKKLRILKSFQKSNDWRKLQEAKDYLMEESSRISEKIEEDERCRQELIGVCQILSEFLPKDYGETAYVTWISIHYDEELKVKKWSINRTPMDMTQIKETLFRENRIVLISDSVIDTKSLLDHLGVKDKIHIMTLSGVISKGHLLITGHLPRPSRLNTLSFLSNFGELVYELLEITPMEIITPSFTYTKVLSELLGEGRAKIVSYPVFGSRNKMLSYTERLNAEDITNFVFIDTVKNMRRKNITFNVLLVDHVPFPSFFDPITSARSSRLIKSAEDYEKFFVPRIALSLSEVITYARGVSGISVITDSRFATGYYADTITYMFSRDSQICRNEQQFFSTLGNLLSRSCSKNLERLHEVSDRLRDILIREMLSPKIDFSAIDPTSYLKTFFGFDQFKLGQKEIIELILTGKDAFAVMPTGHGKSLCYQIPAIAFSLLTEGLTVIISPLQALMRDQVQHLHDNGIIRATYVNSSLSALERNDRLKGIQNGWYDIVYISPEQLRNQKTRDSLMSREVSLFVIDEAHCLSQWGHDFRPDYFYIPRFIEELPQRPAVAAFTATATQKVIADVCNALKISVTPIISPVRRENLRIQVERVRAETSLEADKRKQELLLAYLASQGKEKSGIIYCTYTRTTEDLCHFLRANAEIIGRSPDEIEYFHGKMDGQSKIRVQDGFIGKGGSQISIIVATNAFGMGIDKEDIRFVVHYDIPGSIETFYQEIGRAGRDDDLADCLLLYWKGDLDKQRKLINTVTERDLMVVHEKLKEYSPDESQIYVSEDDLTDDTGMGATTVRIAISQLEKNGYLERGTNVWRTMTVRLETLPEILTSDQERLISSLGLDTSWKTLQIDFVASELGWTAMKTEDELRNLLTGNAPILQEKKEVMGTISDHPDHRLNFIYDLQGKLLRYLLNRSKEFEAGGWTSIQSKEWGHLAGVLSSSLDITVSPTMCRQIIQGWEKENLISFQEGISKTSLMLRCAPEDIYAFLRRKKEIDLLLLRELSMYSENGSFSFNFSAVSSRIGMHKVELRDSLLRMHDFQVISLKRAQNTGNCMTLHLKNPRSDVNPHEMTLKPKDLDLKDLVDLRLGKELKIKTIQKFAEKVDSFEERWQFLENYFKGNIETEVPEIREITRELNERQVDVVTHPAGYLLVNAGAGTGKTLTVARKMLYSSEIQGVPRSNILALTFSKSGVRQLRDKVKEVMPTWRIDVRTYHSLAYHILWQHVGESPLWITSGFTIQPIEKLIFKFESIIDEFEDELPAKDKLKLYQHAIEKLQSEREPIFPEDIRDMDEFTVENGVIQGVHLKKLYSEYLNYLKSNNIIDFGFMISQVVHLFKSRPEALRYYQRRVNHIIVDEYQDTTPIQDEILQMLADWYGNLTAVGDNDQNIFAWSFADVGNILHFDQRYTGARIINLETNYRSTKRILDVSNESIAHNKMRIPKNLFPYRKDQGVPVKVHYTESKEDIGADYIIREIRKIQEQETYELDEIAVLTKTGKQQEIILQALQSNSIAASSPQKEIEMWRSSQAKRILHTMEKISSENPDITAYSCYVEALHALEIEKTQITDTVFEFEENAEDNSASAFIQYARSISGSDFGTVGNKAVNVLTIHKSKGLEFPVVFVTHLRRSSFPMFKGDREEERRVFYVALTRAKDELHLIASSTEKSVFIKEVEHLLMSLESIDDTENTSEIVRDEVLSLIEKHPNGVDIDTILATLAPTHTAEKVKETIKRITELRGNI
ncbi:MAG: RecQ family ATP-dependent DNA helicase [Candidatus Methanofastidiosia archaeon]